MTEQNLGESSPVDVDAIRASVTKQAGYVRQLKADGASQVCTNAQCIVNFICESKSAIVTSFATLFFVLRPTIIHSPFPSLQETIQQAVAQLQALRKQLEELTANEENKNKLKVSFAKSYLFKCRCTEVRVPSSV